MVTTDCDFGTQRTLSGDDGSLLESNDLSADFRAWSPDGRLFAGTFDRDLILIDAKTGDQLHRWKAHNGRFSSLAWSPDGRFIVSSASDHAIKVWDVKSRKQVEIWKGVSAIIKVEWSPDGTMVASVENDGSVCLWNASSIGNRDSIRHMHASAGELVIIDAERLETIMEIKTGQNHAREIAWSHDSTRFISAGHPFPPVGRRSESGTWLTENLRQS